MEAGFPEGPRWVEVAAGLFLGAVALLCLAGLAAYAFDGTRPAPVIAQLVIVALAIACGWALEKCVRLITGHKTHGGLMSPRALRVSAWFFVLLPVGGLFTGYFVTHTVDAIRTTVTYIVMFFALHRLAGIREATISVPRPPSKSD